MDPVTSPTTESPAELKASKARHGLRIASALVCVAIAIVALVPLVSEVSSAFSGEHVWTLETLEFAVAPIAAICLSWFMSRWVEHARSVRTAILLAILSICVGAAGCLPLIYVFGSLLLRQFVPPLL
jgi:Kef-type K+ transport system membrane component KefB